MPYHKSHFINGFIRQGHLYFILSLMVYINLTNGLSPMFHNKNGVHVFNRIKKQKRICCAIYHTEHFGQLSLKSVSQFQRRCLIKVYRRQRRRRKPKCLHLITQFFGSCELKRVKTPTLVNDHGRRPVMVINHIALLFSR